MGHILHSYISGFRWILKNLYNILLNKKHTLLFILVISLPILFWLTGTGKAGSIREKRIKFRGFLTGEGIQKGLKNFENYFEKNFPFRKELLYERNYFYSKYIGISPVDRVILGKNKWLFLKRLNESGSEINYSISIDKFKKYELEYWSNIFNERHRFLKKRGIDLLVVIVPNKSTVYSEYLPDSLKKVTGGVRAKQLTEHLLNNSEIQVLNLKDLLLRNKSDQQLYYRTDSHWNHYGAWLAYREIIRNLSQRFEGAVPFPFEKFRKKKIIGPSRADLASMLALNESLYKEDFRRLFVPSGSEISQTRLNKFKYKKIRQSVVRNKNGVLPKTIMIHDSFGRGLKKYMSASFSEIIFLLDWGFNFFPELIEREKPEIVIYEIAERFFYRPIPDLN